MADVKNGNGWTKYVVGVLVTLVLIIGFPTLINYVIANDKESRVRDACLSDKVQKLEVRQLELKSDILVALAELKSDMNYLKQKVN